MTSSAVMRVIDVLVRRGRWRVEQSPRSARLALPGGPAHWKSAALSLVTISVPVSMFASTVSPFAASRAPCRRPARAHLGRELGDRRQLGRRPRSRDLVGAGVEADDDDAGFLPALLMASSAPMIGGPQAP